MEFGWSAVKLNLSKFRKPFARAKDAKIGEPVPFDLSAEQIRV